MIYLCDSVTWLLVFGVGKDGGLIVELFLDEGVVIFVGFLCQKLLKQF